MKLKFTYEPKDFERMTRADLAAKGLQLGDSDPIKFTAKKGQPYVEVEVDIDDEQPARAAPPPAPPPPPRAPAGEEGEGSETLEEILRRSERMVSGNGAPTRPLMVGEMTDFPHE